MKIISKSKIKYNNPIIQYIISIFLRASRIGLNPVSYTLNFSASPFFGEAQKLYKYKAEITIKIIKLISIIPILLFFIVEEKAIPLEGRRLLSPPPKQKKRIKEKRK
jgi:hypothetical protein